MMIDISVGQIQKNSHCSLYASKQAGLKSFSEKKQTPNDPLCPLTADETQK
jgi:hypothetical protein